MECLPKRATYRLFSKSRSKMLSICSIISLSSSVTMQKSIHWMQTSLLFVNKHFSHSLTGLSHHHTSLHTHLVTKCLLFCILMTCQIIQLPLPLLVSAPRPLLRISVTRSVKGFRLNIDRHSRCMRGNRLPVN